jgi:hypothetical protein
VHFFVCLLFVSFGGGGLVVVGFDEGGLILIVGHSGFLKV